MVTSIALDTKPPIGYLPLMPILDARKKHPMIMPDGTVVTQVVHLNQVISHPRMEIGDFTYYGGLETHQDYAALIAPYLFPLSPEKLVIGKFCQIAHGVRFVTSSANHNMNGFSTYPFSNFIMTPDMSGEDIKKLFEIEGQKGDTKIGNDVWLGMDAVVMPGVTIGNGAIISARAVVTRDVEPWTIIGGNPANPIKKRFSDDVIAALEEIGWWDWPVEVIEANIDVITSKDIDELKRISANL